MRFLEFSELRETILADGRDKLDHPCTLRDVRIAARRDGGRNRFDLELPGLGALPLTGRAAGQFLRRLSIPADFLADRCDPDLAQAVVDRFLAKEPPAALLVRLLRTPAGTVVRAVLPGSWARFDNADMADVAEEVARGRGLRLERYRIEDEAFTCRLLFPEAVEAGREDRPDPHRFGLFLRNSEVGCGVTQVHWTLVREACSNGFLGLAREPLAEMPPTCLHAVRKGGLVERILRGIDAGLEGREEAVGSIRRARGRPIGADDPARALRRIHRFYGLPARNLEIVRETFRRERLESRSSEVTVFTMAGALSRAAQQLPGEEAVRYEFAAWDCMKGGAGEC